MDLWATTETPEVNSYENLPVGKYVARVNRCAMDKTKKDGTPMIAWDFVVTAPEKFEGRHIFLNRVLKNADNVKFAKLDFAKLGHKVDSVSELTVIMESLLDKHVNLSIVQSKTMNNNGEYYINTYVNSMAETAPAKAKEEDEFGF